jgi:beta-lactamase regulating signal transducer with metallopeptidase domain
MSWLPVQTVAQISVERMINALPEGFLIAFFAWVLLRVLRKQNSGTRFAVWFLALLTVAALPVLGGFGAERFGGEQGRALMAAGMSSVAAWGNSWGSMRPVITIPGRWALLVFLAWALGASVAMLRLAAGLWRLRQLRLSCTAIAAADLDPAVRKTVDAIGASGAVASQSVASKSITIATSDWVRVPAAIGFWKRTIVLPAWAVRELPPSDLNVILLHEFAHLRRWDNWTNLIQKIVRALFFFHPAVWWIENRLSVEREMACDDAVLAETANPHKYATCLVSLLEKSLTHRLAHKRWSMAQAAVDRAREASLRLAQILDTNRPVATRVWKPALAMVGAFSLVCLAVLPQAPQFVAFDRGVSASNSDQAYSAAVSRPSFLSLSSSLKTTAVIPAALRTAESSSVGKTYIGTTAEAVRGRAHAHAVAAQQLAPAPVLAVRLNATPPRDGVVEASASADQKIVPEVRTLVFIEATQYMTSDSSVWSVQVWRVTWVSAVRERIARAPAAKSI